LEQVGAGDPRVVAAFKKAATPDGCRPKMPTTIGSLVADIHRNLMSGGSFVSSRYAIPRRKNCGCSTKRPPLAFVGQAGGAAIDGRGDISEFKPTALHQRTPLIIGSKQGRRPSPGAVLAES